MKRFLLGLILIPQFLQADCTLPDGRTIPSGASSEKSLFDPGGTLETHKIQDQDGLGTCYANSSTALLKSVLPDQPDISYHHAGIAYSLKEMKMQKKTSIKYTEKSKSGADESFIEYGNVCYTIKSLKEQGGACPKNFSKLENGEMEDSQVQKRAYLGLGKFYDVVNKVKESPEEMEKLSKDLSSAIEKIKEKKLTQECSPNKFSSHSASRKILSDLKFNSQTCISEDVFNKKINYDQSAFIPPPVNKSNLTPEEKRFDELLEMLNNRLGNPKYPNPKLVESLETQINSDPKFIAELKKYISSNSDKPSKEMNRLMKEKFDKVFKELFPMDSLNPQCLNVSGNKKHPFLGMWMALGDDFSNPMVDDFLLALKNERVQCEKMPESLYSKDQFEKEVKDLLSCSYPHGAVMAPALLALLELEGKLDEDSVKILTNPLSENAKQLMEYLMPACTAPENLIPVDKVSCQETSFCYTGYRGVSFSGEKTPGTCHSLSKAKRIFAAQAIKSLDEGKALNAHTCMAFLFENSPVAKTKFCSQNSTKVNKYGFHEMAVTGYRCENDKIQYQILNSWGESYCPLQNQNIEKNDDFDCSTSTGKFWVSEDVLVDNMQTFSEVGLSP